MVIQSEMGPADACRTHRRGALEPSSPVHVLVRWGGLVAILLFMLALPYLYFRYGLWLHGAPLHVAEFAILGTMLGWLLGRPLAVRVADRRRRPATDEILDHGVSIVVPCFNSADKVEETLQSLLAQTARPIEIIFVENNSTDATLATLRRLEERHPEVRVYSVRTEPGDYAASVAINYGISKASHDIIVRMDDDTVMLPDTVARAIPPLVNGEAVAVACNLRVANPTRSVWTRLQSLEYLLAMELDRRAQVIAQSVLCCSGGLAMFLRETIMSSGGFCSMPKWVSEDIDMTMKHHQVGLVSMRPAAVGFTTVPETLRALVKQRYRWAISGTMALYLHRSGLARRKYWFDGRVGFLGLPVRAVGTMRDLLTPLYPFYLWLLFVRGGVLWLGAVLGAQTAVMAAQLLILRPVLHSRQGLAQWRMLPFFTLVYGPTLLVVRFIGAWSGLGHVVLLRRKEDRLEHAGLEPAAPANVALAPVLAGV